MTQAKDSSTISAVPKYALKKEEDPTNPKGDVLHGIPIPIPSWRSFISQKTAYSCEAGTKTAFSAGTTCGPKPRGRHRQEDLTAAKVEVDSKGRKSTRTNILTFYRHRLA
jgi:hypothetical protein